MRIFVAGASGVIGARLVPVLVAAGHEVAGMTRSPEKLDRLTTLGAEPILCDVYDTEGLRAAVVGFGPDVVIDQLTDLPDDAARIPESAPQIDRMLREGTRNVLGAAETAGARRILAQSIAWEPPGQRGASYREHEYAVLDAGGVVVRYGQLYGPGTYFETEQPPPPRIQIDDAATRTALILDAPPGIVELVD